MGAAEAGEDHTDEHYTGDSASTTSVQSTSTVTNGRMGEIGVRTPHDVATFDRIDLPPRCAALDLQPDILKRSDAIAINQSALANGVVLLDALSRSRIPYASERHVCYFTIRLNTILFKSTPQRFLRKPPFPKMADHQGPSGRNKLCVHAADPY